MIVLKNWRPFAGGLLGEVYGHPKFKEGEQIVTSKLKFIDFKKNIAETQNNTYVLEEPYLDDSTVHAKEDS